MGSVDVNHDPGDTTSLDDSSGPPAEKRISVSTPHFDDVASFVGTRNISDEGKYNLLVNHFKPGADYTFPRCPNGRAFQHKWLQNYPWLVYSKQENGGFCLPCSLFAASAYHGSDPGVLVNRPMTKFKKALELIRNHADMGHHKEAVVRAEGFLNTMMHKQPDIRYTLNEAMDERVRTNRQKLTSIFETVVFCGRNNIALRGHKDSSTDVEKNRCSSENPSHGNFRALLHFRVQAGDTILADHLATAARNATYTSSGIQNEIIDILGDQIRLQIITKVKVARWFSVIAD